MNITTLVEQINGAAQAYRVGTLQQLRRKLLGKNPRTNRIFVTPTDDRYAFHDGGRTEM